MNTLQKLQTKIVNTLVVLAYLLILPTIAAISAQDANVNCPNPGPYEICPPDTDIVIGSVVISDATIVMLVALFAIGIIFLISGSNLKTLINRRNSKNP